MCLTKQRALEPDNPECLGDHCPYPPVSRREPPNLGGAWMRRNRALGTRSRSLRPRCLDAMR